MDINKINKKPKHSFTAKLFHWGFVVIFIYGISKQVDDINQLADISLLKSEIIFAALIILLLLIRYIYVKNSGIFIT